MGAGGPQPNVRQPFNDGARPGAHAVAAPRYTEERRQTPAGTVREVRYEHGDGFRERPSTRYPGYVRRDGRMYGRESAGMYRPYHYGRYQYYRPVPPVLYRPAFYTWTFGAPVTYSWGWGNQGWYNAYRGYFTPYQNYTGMDGWMTDYVISQDMQQAYQAGLAAGSSNPGNAGSGYAQTADPNGAANFASAPPPVITPDLKQQIEAEVRAELQEQQALANSGAGTVAPPVGQNESDVLPVALKQEHTLFRIVAPLKAQINGQSCSLNTGDYILRTSGMLEDGTVSVTVRASRSTDCPQGGVTQISLNDLTEMENERDQMISDGLRVIAANMGKNGLPNGPAPEPTLVAAGQVGPAAGQ